MKYYLTFDVGTTAIKCVVFDEKFHEIFYSNKEYDLNTRDGGYAELDANVYYDMFCECVKDISISAISVSDIRSVVFTTQGETLIPVDTKGIPLCPAIVWLDTRAGKEADVIKNNIGNVRIYEKTGLWSIDGALPAAKILWLYNNRYDIYEKTHKFLLLEDYLIYKLTGKFVSEKSLQSSTGWYDIVDEKIFDEMAELCKISSDKLPQILPCGSVIGNISDDVCDNLGFSPDTYVITGAMDQISSAIGIGNIEEGIFTETTGTALVVGVTTGNPVFDVENPVTVYKHFDDKFIYMPYYSTAGMTLKWFKDTIMPYSADEGKKEGISPYQYIDKVAIKSPAGSNGLIMNPQLFEKGAFSGITLSTNISDMARSVLEGVAYMLRQIVEQIENKNISVKQIHSLGGGSYSDLWCDIKADVCKKDIVRVCYAQTTSLGAAILAAVADGVYGSVADAIKSVNTEGTVIKPNSENFSVYDNGYKNYKNIL